MQSRLTKSLYVGLAALSVASVAAISTTASAKTTVKIVSSTALKTAGETRNLVPTGKNAIYNKPTGMKGVKTVASVNTMKKLAASKKSADYLRAYSAVTTNKGSVYYKVVTMNGKYRGYIYGGKKLNSYSGGVLQAATTKSAALPANTTVHFANPGKSNVTWSAPQYTQYKASKQVKDTTPFAKDALVITKAATKAREGSLYYYVEDATNPSVNGWIYYKAVSAETNTFDAKTDVKVNFKTTDGTVVKTGVLSGLKDAKGNLSAAAGTDVAASAKAQATDAWGNGILAGTGYAFVASDSVNQAALSNAKTGTTIDLFVTKNASVTTKLAFYSASSDITAAATPLTAYKAGATATATSVVFPGLTTDQYFMGPQGASFTAADLTTYLGAHNLSTLNTPSYKNAKGNTVYTTYTLKSTEAGTYGTTAKVVYSGTEVAGPSPVDAPAASTATTGYLA